MDFPERRSQISFPVLVLLSAFLLSTYAPLFFAINHPSILRRRNVIQTVDRVSRMISVDSLGGSPDFKKFTETLKNMTSPPFVIFFDSGNLDVFLNHICNLEFFPNAVFRLAAVSFDKNASLALAEKYPSIPSVLFDLEPMKTSLEENYENRRYILYQLILLARTRICALLALHGINFWAMQQDTIWFDDVSQLELERKFPEAHLIFDTVGNDQLANYALRMQGWICGSTFFVRASSTTYQFFTQIDSFTRSHQSPDSTIMTYLCGHPGYKCRRLPKNVFSNFDYFRGTRDTIPAMIQMDFDHKLGAKMEIFKRLQFRLRGDNDTCDIGAFRNLKNAARLALPERIEKNYVYVESTWTRLKYTLKHIFNVDPFNNKVFLKIHFPLI